MKKFTKIALILAGVCIVLGMSLIIGAGMFGDMYYHNADVHVGPDGVKINGVDLDNIPEDMKKFFDGDSKNGEIVTSDTDRFVLAEENIRNIEIVVNAAEVEIVRSADVEGIVLEDISEYLEFENFVLGNSTVDGKTMHLSLQRKREFNTIGSTGEAYATLVIPADMQFGEFGIEMNASALTAESIEAEKMEVEGNASDMELLDIQAGDLDVNNNAGEMIIKGSVGNELDIEVNAGDVEVQLTGNYQDFNYSVQTNAGSIQIADREYSGLKEEKKIKHDEAKKAAELECNMGRIEVRFFDEV